MSSCTNCHGVDVEHTSNYCPKNKPVNSQPDQTSDTVDQLEQMLLELVQEISSIRAGKTFVPTHYTGPVAKQIRQWISDGIGEDEPATSVVSDPSQAKDVYTNLVKNQKRQEIRKNLGVV